MSHYSVYVFTEDCPLDCCCIDDLMEPYNENRQQYTELTFKAVEDKFLEQMRRLSKADAVDPPGMKEYRQIYANNLAKYNNLDTLEDKMEFLSGWFGYEVADGFFVDYSNPNAKWDYWVYGGRWSGLLGGSNTCLVGKLLESVDVPYAFVTDDGTWCEPGQMGWFGTSNETEDSRKKYEAAFWKYLRSLPEDMWVTILDCHI